MESIDNEQYICPMHCEGEKTYVQPGRCPVCNMKLVPSDKKDNVKLHDQHNKNEHHH